MSPHVKGSLHIKGVESDLEMEGARDLRNRVFVGEQAVPPELEMDEFDLTAFHAVALQDGTVVATGRLIMDTPADARIGRMAVEQDLRRRGIGAKVLAFLEDQARSQGVTRVTLHAQSYVKQFYADHGYQEEGGPFMEAGILHVQMFKTLC